MYYVYVLYSKKSDRLYTGYTEDLRQRVVEHNSGKGGKYSSKNRPFILVYYESFLRKEDATKEEKFYKSGYGREVLNQKIECSKKFAAMVQW